MVPIFFAAGDAVSSRTRQLGDAPHEGAANAENVNMHEVNSEIIRERRAMRTTGKPDGRPFKNMIFDLKK